MDFCGHYIARRRTARIKVVLRQSLADYVATGHPFRLSGRCRQLGWRLHRHLACCSRASQNGQRSSLGVCGSLSEAACAKLRLQSHAQARRHSAPHVGRRHRVQLFIKGGSCPRRIIEKTSFRSQAELRSLLGRGGGEIALGLAMLERAKRKAAAKRACRRFATSRPKRWSPYNPIAADVVCLQCTSLKLALTDLPRRPT